MNKIKLFSCIFMLFWGFGCTNPFSKFLKTQNKIEQTRNKIIDNKDSKINLSSAYVYGVSYALSKDTNRNDFVFIAKDFADKSLLITGNPPAKEALTFRKIVDGLVSTNKNEYAIAEKLLADKDSQIILLEKKQLELQDKLEQQNEKFIKESEQNAKDAQLMVTLRRWFRICMFSIGGIIAFRLACVFIPQLMPLGLVLDHIAGGAIKMVGKALPKATDAAGLVVKESYDLSEKTLSHVIEGIEELKRKYPEVKEQLKPIMQDITDKDTTRAKILDVKQELGYI